MFIHNASKDDIIYNQCLQSVLMSLMSVEIPGNHLCESSRVRETQSLSDWCCHMLVISTHAPCLPGNPTPLHLMNSSMRQYHTHWTIHQHGGVRKFWTCVLDVYFLRFAVECIDCHFKLVVMIGWVWWGRNTSGLSKYNTLHRLAKLPRDAKYCLICITVNMHTFWVHCLNLSLLHKGENNVSILITSTKPYIKAQISLIAG